MQNNTKSKKSENVFQQVANMIAKWAEGKRKAFLQKAYMRNEGSYYDELIFAAWGLLIVTIMITAGFGIYYHMKIFDIAFESSWLAAGGSLTLFLIAEICIVFFGLNMLRSLFNGAWKESFPDVGIFLCLLIIVLAAASWDININTKAVGSINNLINTQELIENQPFAPPPSIAEIDAQIAQVEHTIKEARKSTWKGRPTGEGLKVIEENTKLQQALIKQRTEEMAIAKTEHEALTGAKQETISTSASQLAEYGGYAAYAKLLFVVLIVLFEIKNFEVSKDRESEEDAAVDTALMQQSERPNIPNMGLGFQAIRNRVKQHSEPAPPPPGVSRVSKTVKQLVPQAAQHVSALPETVRETRVVKAPQEDITTWKKYARIYWKRARKQSSSEETRLNNRERFEEYRDLLETAGVTVTETSNGIGFS